MKSKINVSEFLIELEQNFNLWKWNMDGVFIWEIIRVKLFLSIQELLSKEKYDRSENPTTIRRVSNLLERFWRNYLLRNPFLYQNNYDALIFESGRKYNVGGRFVDIYTTFLYKEMQSQGKSVEIYETNSSYDKLSDQTDKVKHIDFIKHFSKILSIFIEPTFSKEDNNLITLLNTEIGRNTGINYDLRQLIITEYKTFRAEKKLYRCLLRIKKPKEIYIVNYMDYFPLTSAAKDAGVVVAELQHGLIIKEALTYHFPEVEDDTLHYFPDKFYQWKGFVHNSGKPPISYKNVIENEHNHLEYMNKFYSQVNKNPYSILVASQPFFSEVISDYILKNAADLQNYIFYYKVHPMEFDTFGITENGKKLSSFANVKILRNEESMYKLLKECKYVIGIYSTSLFEAEIFGCTPLVLSNIDAYTSAFDKKSAVMVDQKKKLKEYIN